MIKLIPKLQKLFHTRVFIIISIICGLIYIALRAKEGGDFKVYLAAADTLLHQHNCYNVYFTLQGAPVIGQYSYSPSFAMLLIPFSQIPVFITEFIFLLSFPVMIWRLWTLASEQLVIEILSPDERMIWSVLLGASTLRFSCIISNRYRLIYYSCTFLWRGYIRFRTDATNYGEVC